MTDIVAHSRRQAELRDTGRQPFDVDRARSLEEIQEAEVTGITGRALIRPSYYR